MRREIPVLRSIEGALQVIDLVADVNAARECISIAVLQRGENWQARKRQIHFRNSAVATIVLELLHKIGRQVQRVSELEQSALRIAIGNNGGGGYLFASRERDSSGGAILHANLGDFDAGANPRARGLCGA